jgi:hypothetical protein
MGDKKDSGGRGSVLRATRQRNCDLADGPIKETRSYSTAHDRAQPGPVLEQSNEADMPPRVRSESQAALTICRGSIYVGRKSACHAGRTD